MITIGCISIHVFSNLAYLTVNVCRAFNWFNYLLHKRVDGLQRIWELEQRYAALRAFLIIEFLSFFKRAYIVFDKTSTTQEHASKSFIAKGFYNQFSKWHLSNIVTSSSSELLPSESESSTSNESEFFSWKRQKKIMRSLSNNSERNQNFMRSLFNNSKKISHLLCWIILKKTKIYATSI